MSAVPGRPKQARTAVHRTEVPLCAVPGRPKQAQHRSAQHGACLVNACRFERALRAAGVALGIGFAALAALADSPVLVQQPRAFGHVIGDVLTQRVLLQHEGHAVEPASMPPVQRTGPWLERRAPRIVTDDAARRWLVVDYQVINSPRAALQATLPALTLTLSTGASLDVPAWSVGIGPLVPDSAVQQGRMPVLQPQREVEPLDTARLGNRFRIGSAATLAVLLSWLLWWAWRNARDPRRLPFARAWREIGPLDPSQPEAWRVVHRAIDASAGHVVHRAGLPSLLDAQPRLQPLRAQLEEFFARSNQRFFGTTGDATLAAGSFDLRGLCRAMRDAERRHTA